MRHPLTLALSLLLLLCSCTSQQQGGTPTAEETDLTAYLLAHPHLLGGIYAAYPDDPQTPLTAAPEGYQPCYISLYHRHGSRYQPSDARYVNTLQRLQQGHEQDVLTPYGESLIPRIQLLCDSCLGHGGMLSSVGERQLRTTGARMAQHFPEVFAQSQPDGSPLGIYARASVVPRCGASMRAFLEGLSYRAPEAVTALSHDSVMRYVAYDTPAMRALSSLESPWQADYISYRSSHFQSTRFIQAIYSDATGVDTLQTAIDLYWLVVGMQDVDVPGCDLSDVFTPEELLQCYQCVNYRMYVCNATWPDAHDVPRLSASTLLYDIVGCADAALAEGRCCADLRFGHDSNLLRLLALMRLQGASLQCGDPAQAWQLWHEYELSPMAANLQLIFYRHPDASQPVLVKLLLNEHETRIDAPALITNSPEAPYYVWSDLRAYFLSQLSLEESDGVGTVNIQ